MRTTHVTYLISLCFCLFPMSIFGQLELQRSVIGSLGGFQSNGNLSIGYSSGESVVSVNSFGVGLQVSEGFQQPLPLLAATLTDSVWPGDANWDGIANHFDLLSIGLTYGLIGPIRPAANLNWTAQYAPDWADSLATGINYKHSDCNGDGMVNMDDTLAINLNYGMLHMRGGGSHSGDPLFLVYEQDSLLPGDTAVIQVHYGDGEQLVEDVYGLAFSIVFDTAMVDMGSVMVQYDSSWFGTKNQNMITLDHTMSLNGQVDIAMVGIDLTDRDGSGMVAKVSIIMIDDLAGRGGFCVELNPILTNSRAINQSESLKGLQLIEPDPIVICENTLNVPSQSALSIQVYPNPASTQLRLETEGFRADGYLLRNQLGQEVMKATKSFRQLDLNVEALPAGVYCLEVQSNQTTISQKVLITNQD